MASRFPMVLPTLHFLRLDADGAAISDIMHSVQADSLIALSLGGWEVKAEAEESTVDDQRISQFPSLEHLILDKDMPGLDVFARSFPQIKRLTVGARCDLIHMCTDTQEDGRGGASCSDDWEQWPSLQVFAVAGFESASDLMGLPNIISKVKRGGHPIRKLMLPKKILDQAGVDDVVELRKLVEVEDFSIDWPNPFDQY
ncbi:hypothetical protein FIBSPDRAFT_866742 [Athelia psychrophila]|uniref:Uncharacterized protein n=1 Tax=Athelia psychrophila TaxID=1759441 RepID=A0A166EK42_9AGAM|nr:hypothetical protein FIBSPDRAFT_866742 [Fibularhizoctonia sp. CBS 109695]